MSITPKITIVKKQGKDFSVLAEEVLVALQKSKQTIVRILFFTDVENNDDFLQKQAYVLTKSKLLFAEKTPLISIISQAPFEYDLIAEIHSTDASVTFKNAFGTNYIVAKNNEEKALFTTLIPEYSTINAPIAQQAEKTFATLTAIFEKEEMTIDCILRQWNYVERIIDTDSLGQRYQQFNDARSHFYAQCFWQNGYPAATGIGTQKGGLSIDIDAYAEIYTKAIDNPLQIAAHRYSENVLESGKQPQQTTPKFERARIIDNTLYISGTAAIRGEETIANNAKEQTQITIENILALVQQTDKTKLDYLRVYIKNKTDFTTVKNTVSQLLPNIETLFVEADICRANLLVEIEAVAV
jgi:enamine deaminase RidA (YjgF/YER057c/UK114 family)